MMKKCKISYHSNHQSVLVKTVPCLHNAPRYKADAVITYDLVDRGLQEPPIVEHYIYEYRMTRWNENKRCDA